MGGYLRPKGAAQSDFLAAREFEEEVGSWLGDYRVGNLTASNKLDWHVPGFFVEVKEKKQQLGDRFAKLWPTVDREHLFVVDEQSVRRAIPYSYQCYFLIRDVPLNRYFLARLDELLCAERVRANRETSPGRLKGKWVLDLRHFRQIEPGPGILKYILADQTDSPWSDPECLSQMVVQNV